MSPLLLDEVLEAHGGVDRWRAARAISARVSLSGPFWDLRAVPASRRTNVSVGIQLHHQVVSLSQWTDAEHRFVLRTNPDVATMTAGEFVEPEVRHNPRASFPTAPDAHWDQMQANYFVGYAMWNYLTTPYLLTFPGVRTFEMKPWTDDGHKWRRLGVHFPPTIATHSPQQVFYFNDAGLLQRLDYHVEVSGGAPAAHYVDEYVEVDGLKFPRRRMVFLRRADNTPDREAYPASNGMVIDAAIDHIVVTS